MSSHPSRAPSRRIVPAPIRQAPPNQPMGVGQNGSPGQGGQGQGGMFPGRSMQTMGVGMTPQQQQQAYAQMMAMQGQRSFHPQMGLGGMNVPVLETQPTIPENTLVRFRTVRDGGETRMLWFATPPVDVLPATEEPGHSLAYLAYLQKKQEDEGANGTDKDRDVEMGTEEIKRPGVAKRSDHIPKEAIEYIAASLEDYSRVLQEDTVEILSRTH